MRYDLCKIGGGREMPGSMIETRVGLSSSRSKTVLRKHVDDDSFDSKEKKWFRLPVNRVCVFNRERGEIGRNADFQLSWNHADPAERSLNKKLSIDNPANPSLERTLICFDKFVEFTNRFLMQDLLFLFL